MIDYTEVGETLTKAEHQAYVNAYERQLEALSQKLVIAYEERDVAVKELEEFRELALAFVCALGRR
ncbi:MAG: hypothetical protein IPJ65_38185 [Archangiaceae bacterium]|nr:hypothetical protein [Archangiaceae bacterium]